MRVVAGWAGGKRLLSPPSKLTRPTSDRVREAIFNSLTSLDAVEGAEFVDLFAGTGACGIEALSRGANASTFVEKDRKTCDVIRRNLVSVGLDGTVVSSEVMSFLARTHRFDVAIIDPPYDFADWPGLLDVLDAGLAVCEASKPVEPTSKWKTVRTRKHGETHVTLLERS